MKKQSDMPEEAVFVAENGEGSLTGAQRTLQACMLAPGYQPPGSRGLLATAYEGGQIDDESGVPTTTEPEDVKWEQGARGWRDACGSGASLMEEDWKAHDTTGKS